MRAASLWFQRTRSRTRSTICFVDSNGRASIEWGVYGVPETFLIGPDGRILDKHVGPLDGPAASRLLAKAAALVK